MTIQWFDHVKRTDSSRTLKRELKLKYGMTWDLGWHSGYGTALLVGRSRDRFSVVSPDISVIYCLLTTPWTWGQLSP